MLKIWGRLSSINVRKVVLTAQWLGVPFQRVDAGHEFGIVDTPDYRTRNPNGLVPLVEDGELVLWESNVIVRYLCAKHSPGELYPEDLAQRFDAEQLMALLDAHLERRPFMAGDAFTMADIPIACEFDRWRALPLERPARPNLERWYRRILAHPAANGVLQLSPA